MHIAMHREKIEYRIDKETIEGLTEEIKLDMSLHLIESDSE